MRLVGQGGSASGIHGVFHPTRGEAWPARTKLLLISTSDPAITSAAALAERVDYSAGKLGLPRTVAMRVRWIDTICQRAHKRTPAHTQDVARACLRRWLRLASGVQVDAAYRLAGCAAPSAAVQWRAHVSSGGSVGSRLLDAAWQPWVRVHTGFARGGYGDSSPPPSQVLERDGGGR